MGFRKKLFGRKRKTRERGSALLLGVGVAVMSAGGIVLAITLLENVSTSIYYQTKLNMLASQAALYASTLNESDSRKSADTQLFLDNLLTSSHLPKSQSATVVTSSGQVNLSIVVNGLPVIGYVSVLPGSVNLSASSTVPLQSPNGGFVCSYANSGANAGNHYWMPIGQFLPPGVNGWQIKHFDAIGRTDEPSDSSGPTNVVTPAN